MTSNQPWLAREDWAARRVTHRSLIQAVKISRGTLVVLIAFLALLGALALILGILGMVGVMQDPKEDAGGVAGFGGAMLVLAGGLVYWWQRAERFGESVCRLETLPGVIGGWFKARVVAKLRVRPTESLSIALENSASWNSNSWGSEDSILHWKASYLLTPHSLRPIAAGCFDIPIRFTIPHDVPRVPGSVWILKIHAALEGPDYRAGFLVPVFETDQAPADEQKPESLGWRQENWRPT